MNVKVQPTLSGFLIEIDGGTPPYEIYYLDSVLIYKGNTPFFHYNFDLSYNTDDAFFVVKDSTGEKVVGFPSITVLDKYERGFVREILRREYLVLRKKGGFEIKVFKRKKPGITEPCPKCRTGLNDLVPLISDIGSELTICSYCFGTGLAGGYYPPLKCYANYFSFMTNRVDALEPVRSNPVSLYTLNYPSIEVGDLIWIDALGKMVRVEQTQLITYKGVELKQIIQGKVLMEGHPAYRLSKELPVVIVDRDLTVSDKVW